MDEFALIRHYFSGLTTVKHGVVLGVGDDAALLRVPSGEELAVTTDTLVAGRHFTEDAPPEDIGWKSLAVNLSDLAAMGAKPRWFTLALTLRLADPDWLEGFARGLRSLAEDSGIALVGGDTTQGPLSITITAMGTLEKGSALKRSGAKVGDLVCVTGTLGDAALALRMRDAEDLPESLSRRLHRPQPRNTAGLALRGKAHAVIDLSDGLAGDLQHILDASKVGAEVRVDQLPLSEDFRALAPVEQRLALQAGGGDDYELCACIAPGDFDAIQKSLDVPLTVVGKITKKKGLRFVDAAGKAVKQDFDAYRHFQ
ncbi:MAG TPA: thiamine-phosphate kinase [Nevskiaceae bacterium]|nr:thiamine-phosphate kinase [Nevskiaceae bacterium]